MLAICQMCNSPSCKAVNIYTAAWYRCEKCGYEFIPICIYGIDKNTDKPPLGAKPCHIHAEQRIEDLSNAILRNVGSEKPKYDFIRKWAKEIVLQCDLAEIIED